jgi:hypothetical protein
MYVPAAMSALLGGGGEVVSPEYSHSHHGAHEPHAHDESPVSGDGARSYGVVQDNFCLSELVAV